MITTIVEFMGKDHERLDNLFEAFKKQLNDDIVGAGEIFLEFKAGLENTYFLGRGDIVSNF